MLSAVPQVTLIQRLLFGSGRDHCYLELAVDAWRGHHSAAHSHGDTTFHPRGAREARGARGAREARGARGAREAREARGARGPVGPGQGQ